MCKACERASETREPILHGQEQNRMRMASLRESQDSDRFLVNTHVQSPALLRRGFGTSVPFICTCNCVHMYMYVGSNVSYILFVQVAEHN